MAIEASRAGGALFAVNVDRCRPLHAVVPASLFSPRAHAGGRPREPLSPGVSPSVSRLVLTRRILRSACASLDAVTLIHGVPCMVAQRAWVEMEYTFDALVLPLPGAVPSISYTRDQISCHSKIESSQWEMSPSVAVFGRVDAQRLQ